MCSSQATQLFLNKMSNAAFHSATELKLIEQITQSFLMAEKVQYFADFLFRRQQQVLAKKRQKQRQLIEINQRKNQEESVLLQDLVCEEDRITDDQAVEKGEIIRVNAFTLLENSFKVDVRYKHHRCITIATKQEIIKKNIGALLDFYQNYLELRDARKNTFQ